MPSTEVVGDCCSGTTRTYVDESFRAVTDASGLYLIGAVSLDVTGEEESRASLRKALPNGLARFHWNKDSDSVRDKAIEAVLTLNLAATVFLQTDVPSRRQERYRQHGLWNLVPTLAERCQHNLTFEARERSQDAKDTRTLVLQRLAGGATAGDRMFADSSDQVGPRTLGRALDAAVVELGLVFSTGPVRRKTETPKQWRQRHGVSVQRIDPPKRRSSG